MKVYISLRVLPPEFPLLVDVWNRNSYSCMRQILIFYIFLLSGLLLKAQEKTEEQHAIYVASISWHTGIVVPAYSLPDSIWPPGYDYSGPSYLEIGWGDRDFYQHRGFNIWYAFKATFWPTSSALHVNPLPENIQSYYTNTRVVKIEVTEEQLNDISRYILEHFEFNEKGRFIPLEAGIYSDSQFFAGSTKYYFPKNSNVWVARALKRAGFSITPIFYQTTGWVLNKAEKFGKAVVDE